VASNNSTFSSLEFCEAYGKADAALRLRQSKVYLVLCLVLVPACVGLDYFVYPQLVWRIFGSRLICDIVMLPCFFALFTAWGQRHVVFLSKLPPLAPCITICWMIFATEGVLSQYYAGINLVLVGVILLIPYTLGEAGVICGLVVLCYALACWLHENIPGAAHIRAATLSSSRSSFVNNIYFLGSTAIIALSACYYASLRRLEDFRLRYELDENNRELASTLTKLQETEVQLVQSEKMNALGKLSAGLLHEINNPLNFTFMALQIAQQEAGENNEIRDTLKDIGEGMERIRTVISDLRAFAYPSHQMDVQEFSLAETISSALRLTTHELGAIAVEREPMDDIKVVGGSTQIVHVFMNLLVNAVHALKAKGLTEQSRIKIYSTPEHGRIRISVRDNGSGVAPANLPKLLDPFFTTKSPDQGMGLGLSICHTIVKNHGGTIRVESEVGQWTDVSFDLSLAPVSARSAA